MYSQFPIACSILVAGLASAAPFVPPQTLSACVGVAGAAVVVSASVRPPELRLRTGDDCTVVVAGRPVRP